MIRLTRRSFVQWLGGVAASIGIARRTRAGALAPKEPAPLAPLAPLDAAVITKLAAVVLPGELGDAGLARASRAFTMWAAEYRKGAEILHPYGSGTIRQAPELPLARWNEQLAALNRESRARHGRAFIAATVEQRHALVVASLAGERTDRMGEPQTTNHVALALVSWWFGTPEATDLCYRAKIGKNQCRPLVNSAREPLPLAPVRGGAGGPA